MSRGSRKSDLSPSITKGSNGIDLGKSSGVDMGRKSEPSITSGGVGITQEVTNVGGMSVTGGVSVDISPLNFGINANPSENSISVAGGAEVPGGILGISGGLTIDTNTGEIIGGSIGGEIGGLGINVSNSEKGGLGIEFTVQIPGTRIELSLGFGFPPKDEPKPTPTPTPTPIPSNSMPGGWVPTVPPLPPFNVSPGRYYVRTTRISADGSLVYSDGNGTTTYSVTPPQTGQLRAPSISPPAAEIICTNITQQNIENSRVNNGGVFYRSASNDAAYYMGRKINRIEIYSPVRTMAPFGTVALQRETYYRRIRIIPNTVGYIAGTIINNPVNLVLWWHFPENDGEGVFWEWMEWELISRITIELIRCDELPAPPPPPPPPNPPPRRKNKMNDCCKENLKFLRAIYIRLGLAKFPGKLPATIIQEVPKEGEKPAEPPQVPINDFVDLLDWQFRRDDERWGQWVVQIDVKDADITKEGDQNKQIKFPNLAESIAEMEGQILSLTANVDALVALQIKNLAESGMARQEAIKGYLAAKAIIKYMAFKSSEIDVPIPMTFTAGAESISELLKESEGHIKATDYNEKETLRDVYLDLLQAAAIILAVHWQRIDTKSDTKNQLLSILKGSVDLASTIANPKKSTDGEEKKFDPAQNFEDFIDDVENGFRNTTGISDIENPYGRTPNRRPRIREIGDNLSEAGGNN